VANKFYNLAGMFFRLDEESGESLAAFTKERQAAKEFSKSGSICVGQQRGWQSISQARSMRMRQT